MCRVCYEIIECIGHTASYRIASLSKNLNTSIWGKIEQNITGSVYDRVIAHLIHNNDRIIKEKKILALNFVGEIRSLNLIDPGEDGSISILTTNEKSGRENGLLLSFKGWRIMDLKREVFLSNMFKASGKSRESEGLCVVNLWDSDVSVSVFGNLAGEILDELGCVEYFISSIFDPSVLIGVARVFKKECGRAVKIYGVEPSHISVVSSWYYSGGESAASLDPVLNFIYDAVPNVILRNRDLIDGFINVDYREIISMWRKILLSENLDVGYISSVNIAGARRFVEKEKITGGRVVIPLTDSLTMYIGTEYFINQFLSKQMHEPTSVSTSGSS